MSNLSLGLNICKNKPVTSKGTGLFGYSSLGSMNYDQAAPFMTGSKFQAPENGRFLGLLFKGEAWGGQVNNFKGEIYNDLAGVPNLLAAAGTSSIVLPVSFGEYFLPVQNNPMTAGAFYWAKVWGDTNYYRFYFDNASPDNIDVYLGATYPSTPNPQPAGNQFPYVMSIQILYEKI